MTKFNKEIIGYTGMILIIGSFLIAPSNIMFLFVNLTGCIFTVVYSFIMRIYPVLLMNFAIAIFDILYVFNISIIS